jgi:hypothetical protein
VSDFVAHDEGRPKAFGREHFVADDDNQTAGGGRRRRMWKVGDVMPLAGA